MKPKINGIKLKCLVLNYFFAKKAGFSRFFWGN